MLFLAENFSTFIRYGGGVPPIPLIFLVKNRPKNSVFWAKNAVFGGKFVEFRPDGGSENERTWVKFG